MPCPTSQPAPSGAGAPRPEASASLDRVEALRQPVAGDRDVVRLGARREISGSPGHDDVAAPELERVQPEPAGQLVHRRLDRERRLADRP